MINILYMVKYFYSSINQEKFFNDDGLWIQCCSMICCGNYYLWRKHALLTICGITIYYFSDLVLFLIEKIDEKILFLNNNNNINYNRNLFNYSIIFIILILFKTTEYYHIIKANQFDQFDQFDQTNKPDMTEVNKIISKT